MQFFFFGIGHARLPQTELHLIDRFYFGKE
jgi:hypothetical protein